MPTLHAALNDHAAAGLYRLSGRIAVATVRREAEVAGRYSAVLDGAAIGDKAGLLRACAGALGFPAYVGRNWDALEEALRDLAWLDRPSLRGYVVLLDPAAHFMRHAPADWATARAIFASAVAHWRATPIPLTILLRRADGLASDLPLIAERPARPIAARGGSSPGSAANCITPTITTIRSSE